jgi:hypothetical protein
MGIFSTSFVLIVTFVTAVILALAFDHSKASYSRDSSCELHESSDKWTRLAKILAIIALALLGVTSLISFLDSHSQIALGWQDGLLAIDIGAIAMMLPHRSSNTTGTVQ